MQFTVDSAFNSSYEVQLADNYPNIRVLSVGTSTISGVVCFTPISSYFFLCLPILLILPIFSYLLFFFCSIFNFYIRSHCPTLPLYSSAGALLPLLPLVVETGRILLSLHYLSFPSFILFCA